MDEQVGAADASFSPRARARTTSLIEEAKILVFATHDMDAAADLCNRAVLMAQGRVAFEGAVPDAVAAYIEAQQASHTPNPGERARCASWRA